MRACIDSNVVIDYINKRDPFYKDARLLMLLAKLAEFELWIGSSQVTDIIYIASNGASSSLLPSTLAQLRDLRSFVKVYPVGPTEIDSMLASDWRDPEDRLIYEVALGCNADAIVTRDKSGFETNAIKVCDCAEFFEWLRDDYGLDYAEIDI